jgi:hypothetical protein
MLSSINLGKEMAAVNPLSRDQPPEDDHNLPEKKHIKKACHSE